MKYPMDTSAAAFIPAHFKTLNQLRAAAKACQGCDLYRYATQTVFGEGSQQAKIVLLGEQPGDQEDRQGRPFVGPAGHLLDRALLEAGLDRQITYVSNVVKHFKFKGKGKIRFHKKPTGLEIRACHPWLEAEMHLLKPEVTICLGASAAEGVLRRKVTIRDERGHLQDSPFGGKLMVTVHPSSILRIPDEDDRHTAYHAFVEDLRLVQYATTR